MDEEFLRATISIRGIVRRPDETVLVVRRSSDDNWELPGGRIHRTEDVVDCLRREIDEEAGLDVTVHAPVKALSWRNEADEDRFAVYYHCTTDADAVTLSDEHTAARWVTGTTARERLSAPQSTAVAEVFDADSQPTVGPSDW